MAHKTDVDENAEMARIRETVRQWRVEAARAGKPLKLPVMPFLLRNIWTGALLLFSVLCFSTFFISTVFQVRRVFKCQERCLNKFTGHHLHQFVGYMLGGYDVGALCDNHGGGETFREQRAMEY